MSSIPAIPIAIVSPMLITAVSGILARQVWSRTDTAKEIGVSTLRIPISVGVSILAITLPLVTQFVVTVAKDAGASWETYLLLSATVVASISLIAGGYLIYTVYLDQADDSISIGGDQGNLWLPVLLSIQFTGLVVFLVSSTIALIGYVLALVPPA